MFDGFSLSNLAPYLADVVPKWDPKWLPKVVQNVTNKVGKNDSENDRISPEKCGPKRVLKPKNRSDRNLFSQTGLSKNAYLKMLSRQFKNDLNINPNWFKSA